MESQCSRQQDQLRFKAIEEALMRKISEQDETINMLEAEVRRGRNEIRSKLRTICSMQATLVAHDLPMQHSISSLHVCQARDDEELCPLSMAPINSSPPPFEGCDVPALDPMNPQYKCAELICGHRFNCIWLMCHFVQNRTFRCLLCRSGKRNFQFDLGVIPEPLVNAIRRHRNTMGASSA
jgi:hypothetical protein